MSDPTINPSPTPDPNAPGTPPAPAPEPQGQAGAEAAPDPTLSKDDKTLGMAAHLLGLVGFLGPLILWLVKKDDSEFAADQSKEALNWEITMLIGYVISAVPFIGCLVLPAVLIVDIVFNIIAAVKANEGVRYRYPFALRLVK